MVTTSKRPAIAAFVATTLLALAASSEPASSERPKNGGAPIDARADGPSRAPLVQHAPISTAVSGRDIRVEASFERADLIKQATVVFTSDGGFREAAFLRSESGAHVAVIPGVHVARGKLSYTIEITTVGGERVAIFATRDAPFSVTVVDDPVNVRQQAALRRVAGRRSVVWSSVEYVRFGKTEGVTASGAPASIADQYYRVEAGYTYRLFGVLEEFGIKAGVVRGRSVVPGTKDPSKYEVGLNYGAPTARLRVSDWLHIDGELLTSITEVGFSVGGGGAVIVGDPYGAKLTLGFEAIEVFGTRAYSRLDLVVSPSVRVAPIVEITDMPHAAKTGVRLLTEVTVALPQGFGVAVRGGYQARDSVSGGPSLGTGVSYAF